MHVAGQDPAIHKQPFTRKMKGQFAEVLVSLDWQNPTDAPLPEGHMRRYPTQGNAFLHSRLRSRINVHRTTSGLPRRDFTMLTITQVTLTAGLLPT